ASRCRSLRQCWSRLTWPLAAADPKGCGPYEKIPQTLRVVQAQQAAMPANPRTSSPMPRHRPPPSPGVKILYVSTSTRQHVSTSLPLNRRRRLRRDIVHDPVHAFHLVDDPSGEARQELGRKARPVGGHAVHRLDDADGEDVLVGALVAHHADGAHGKED